MNILPKISIAVSAAAALSFAPLHGVEGAVSRSMCVECLEEAWQVCVVETVVTTPSPGTFCPDPNNLETCETNLLGGWSWDFTILENLANGINTEIDMAMEDAIVDGFNVNVIVDEDMVTCVVSVRGEECNMCSAEGCANADDWPTSIKYDCTNLQNGISSDGDCLSLQEPFLYPLLIKSESEEEEDAEDEEQDASISSFDSADGDMADLNMGASDFVDTDGGSGDVPVTVIRSSASRITLGGIMYSVMMLSVTFV